jgi:hypothetical protein
MRYQLRPLLPDAAKKAGRSVASLNATLLIGLGALALAFAVAALPAGAQTMGAQPTSQPLPEIASCPVGVLAVFPRDGSGQSGRDWLTRKRLCELTRRSNAQSVRHSQFVDTANGARVTPRNPRLGSPCAAAPSSRCGADRRSTHRMSLTQLRAASRNRCAAANSGNCAAARNNGKRLCDRRPAGR